MAHGRLLQREGRGRDHVLLIGRDLLLEEEDHVTHPRGLLAGRAPRAEPPSFSRPDRPRRWWHLQSKTTVSTGHFYFILTLVPLLNRSCGHDSWCESCTPRAVTLVNAHHDVNLLLMPTLLLRVRVTTTLATPHFWSREEGRWRRRQLQS